MFTPTRIALAAAAVFLASAGVVRAQDWPEIYDPLVLRTLNLQMSNEDWQTIQHDETFDIWVPTLLWLDGEAPILVAIRRKSADALTNAPGFLKVSYKLDINEYVAGQDWHDLRALSLDNGDDENVVSEGLAWYLHRVASGPEGYGYDAGLASWVRLVINGVDTGVYVSAEQRDKRFLQNRGLWIDDETWLYEVEDLQGQELDEGGPGDSPLVTSLCYSPFASPSLCPTPDPATLAAVLPPVIDMQGLLALAAVDAFSANPDAVFSHGKNFYFVDYLAGQQRLYLPWDLDSALSGGGVNAGLYAPQSNYSQILLNVPAFRAQYSHILNELVCGPFRESSLHAFLDALEPVLSDALAADPNNQLGGESVAEFFEARRDWFSARLLSVQAQIEGFVPCGSGCDPAATYCTAKLNSLGCLPSIGSNGTPSLSGPDNFHITASSLTNQQLGMLIWSTAPDAAPFFGGTLCLLPPILRTTPMSSGGSTPAGSDCTGTFSFHFSQAYMATIPLSAGTTLYAQYWMRDTADPLGLQVGLSNALEFELCP